MTPAIRHATAADLDALVAIDSMATEHPWSRGQFADSLANHTVLVLEEAGVPRGFLVYSRVLDEVELLNVAVDPAWQGSGHGAALVARLMADNRLQASRIWLEVRASNHRAIALYRRQGFTQRGVRKGYYPVVASGLSERHREDAWIMAYDY